MRKVGNSFILEASDYVAMHHWHVQSGSGRNYIQVVQERACQLGAPVDAIYELLTTNGEATGNWMRVANLAPAHPFRKFYEMELTKQLLVTGESVRSTT